MPLRIAPAVLSDFDTIISHTSRFSPGDDLVAPPISQLCWPVQNSDDALRRLQFDMAHQRGRFLKEPSVRFMKVIDDENGEIICLASWHYLDILSKRIRLTVGFPISGYPLRQQSRKVLAVHVGCCVSFLVVQAEKFKSQ